MKRYRVNWISKRFGESYIDAKNKKEAKKLAMEGKDEDFEESDYLDDWFVESVDCFGVE